MTGDTICSSSGVAPVRHNSCVAKDKVTPEGRLAGERIKRAMAIATGGPFNQTQFADLVKIPYSRLGNYIQGTRRLPIHEAKKIERSVGIPAAYLMGLVDDDDMQLLRAPKSTRAAVIRMLNEISPNTHRP